MPKANTTQNPAPDALTEAAAAQAKADAEAGKTPEQIEAEAAAARQETSEDLKAVKPKYYRSVHGGTMIDPETQKVFNGDGGTKSHMTSWLDFQIANGKIAEDE